MPIDYEWHAIEIDVHGDALCRHFLRKREDAESQPMTRRECSKMEIALVRDVIVDGHLVDRQYAYLSGGNLPEEFDGGAKVPKRFLNGQEK